MEPRGALGGTFDKFHRGHKEFLATALEKSGELLIGITSDRYAKASKKHSVDPYEVRLANVKRFVQQSESMKRVEIVEIDDPYGPTVKDRDLEILFVTSENKYRGQEINQERRKNGLPPLEIFEVSLKVAEDGEPISSTRIREGTIDSEGRLLRCPKGSN